jgi:radical SAM protein with 4Fe4S-binding SPASM domain
MAEYVKILRDAGFLSYFSCNPVNINMVRTIEMIDSGLNYIKYSIESINDEEHRKVRGGGLNFTECYHKIEQILRYKKEKQKNLTVVITMLDLNRANQKEDYDKLLDAFKNLDVYIYLKSEDCQWYRKDFHGTQSIHWSEICKHPWMSMTIKSNGEATMCMEDYNNEIVLGNANTTLLKDIWNGEKYKEFRRQHLRAKDRIKCVDECDMKLFGDCYKVN